MSVDEQDAVKALTHRLIEWGVDGAADKAKLYVHDLVSHGWAMRANVRPIRRPPQRNEECRTHVGEWRDFCRGCVADRKAAAEDAQLPSGRWTPERIRADIATPRSPGHEAAGPNRARPRRTDERDRAVGSRLDLLGRPPG